MVTTDDINDIQEDAAFNKIRTQLTKCLDKPTPARKRQVYRAMSSIEGKYSTKLILEAIFKLIEELGQKNPGQRHLLSYWRQRIIGAPVMPASASRVYGKWIDSQVVAGILPLMPVAEGLEVNGFEVDLTMEKNREEWRARGFAKAIPLPLVYREAERASYVCVASGDWRNLASHGYAEAMPLQWRRQIEEPSWFYRQSDYDQPPEYASSREDRPGLYVERSLIGFGFWKAYKWWRGCRDWYFIHHPEWFCDDPIWGSEIVEAVFGPPGAAVISPSSLANFRRLNVTG